MAKRRKRAVAYVRVSTASSAQLHSYEYQEQYWQGKFTDDPDTELVGIYADRGISGSSIYKRPQFLVMMQDARDGKFDIFHFTIRFFCCIISSIHLKLTYEVNKDAYA